MSTNLLALADHLSDDDLLARLGALAICERGTTTELVAHLASLEARPSAYAAKGFGSLFAYCTQALRLSEDGRTVKQIERLIAELAPKPDVPTSVRKVPTITIPPPPTAAEPAQVGTLFGSRPAVPPDAAVNPPLAAPTVPRDQSTPPRSPERSTIEATAPGRYRVRFMIDDEMHARLRRVQTLLRREIPGGDAREIFDRALTLLEAQVERTKLGRSAKRRATRPIRSETDRPRAMPSRHIPDKVKDDVERRDGGQCAFVAADGRRCTERAFLEFHHQQAYANGGEATFDNISLRCRRHNQYEAELVFGAYRGSRGWDHSQMTKDSIRTPPPGA